jgi:polyisoprenoid-binding protein YceI
MSATAVNTKTQLPVGTWTLDPTHSSAGFAVRHMGVATFRGRFEHLDAKLTIGADGAADFVGTVRADSIVVKDENLRAHLLSPEFFDTERYPELSFRSRSLRQDGEELMVDGELTIKDQTHAVEAQGSLAGPAETLGDAVKIGVQLETVIDRSQFGLNWNAPLPGGGVALGNEVRLTVELELARADESEE